MSSIVSKSSLVSATRPSLLSAKLQRTARYSHSSQRRSMRIQCRSTSGGPEDPRQTDFLQQCRIEANRFTERYDILSTGAGALVCTSYFWSRGQNPVEALWITFCATIVGLVVNEVVFKGEN